ncbi:RHS repeat-associated core domain-containing protein [uncultured Shewanella sp.]|uniref:RHS repeat domain-containing protein n=1 Tax=uncultured Shewanella sp. TaxID=173975 RepID=UPI00261832AE|nr:RHS repeat-associated core domain-containing protein [uncultured Shewanella sp.]
MTFVRLFNQLSVNKSAKQPVKQSINKSAKRQVKQSVKRSRVKSMMAKVLAVAFGVILPLLSNSAQAQGQTAFVPIAVGDIVTFIPLLSTPTQMSVKAESVDGSYQLKWNTVPQANYYQVIITDEKGKQRIVKVTGTSYALAGLNLGNNKVELQACNKNDQCGAPSLVSNIKRKTKITYQHTDMLGSPVMQSDEAGNALSRSVYDPFGKRLGGDKAGIGYTGHLHDKDLGLTYMQARYYDPLIGRFYSNDPVGFADTTHSFNRYAYANNNPYKYVDPDGEFVTVPLAGFGALVGGVGAGLASLANGGNIKQAAIAASVGATIGGIAGLTGGTSLFSHMAVGSIAGGSGDFIGQVIPKIESDTSSLSSFASSTTKSVVKGVQHVNYQQVVSAAALSAFGGGVDKYAKAIGLTEKSAAVVAETTNLLNSPHAANMASGSSRDHNLPHPVQMTSPSH